MGEGHPKNRRTPMKKIAIVAILAIAAIVGAASVLRYRNS
jgi:hypothetical protein